MSSLRVNSIQNTSGVQQYLAQAWVNFNGANGTIRAAGNVSSATRNGTGDYTVNFTTGLADANYSVVGMADNIPSNSASTLMLVNSSIASPYQSSSIRLIGKNSNGTGLYDSGYVNVAIFR